jgi:hypothetical protein
MLEIVFRNAVVVEEEALSIGEKLFIQTFTHENIDAAMLCADSVERICPLSHMGMR